jgi:hypothetical protein
MQRNHKDEVNIANMILAIGIFDHEGEQALDTGAASPKNLRIPSQPLSNKNEEAKHTDRLNESLDQGEARH